MTTHQHILVQGLIAGLLFGAGVGGHVLRLVTLRGVASTPMPRVLVAAAGVLLYALAGVLVLVGATSGYVIAAVGPLVGLTAVVLLPKTDVDAFQIALGVFQIVAGALSGWVLISKYLGVW